MFSKGYINYYPNHLQDSNQQLLDNAREKLKKAIEDENYSFTQTSQDLQAESEKIILLNKVLSNFQQIVPTIKIKRFIFTDQKLIERWADKKIAYMLSNEIYVRLTDEENAEGFVHEFMTHIREARGLRITFKTNLLGKEKVGAVKFTPLNAKEEHSSIKTLQLLNQFYEIKLKMIK